MYKISEQQISPKVLSDPIRAIIMKIPNVTEIVYTDRQMPTSQNLPPTNPPPPDAWGLQEKLTAT